MRRPRLLVFMLLLASALVISGCGGGGGGNSSGGGNNNPPPGSALVGVTITDTPPAGVAVLAFQVTVNSAMLQPGNVQFISNPTTVELARLQTDNSLLGTAFVKGGTYNSISLTASNAKVTILNNSGSTIGSCGIGQVCTFQPSLPSGAVTYSGAPFPLTVAENTPIAIRVDFDLQKSLQGDLSLTPTLGARKIAADSVEIDDVYDVVGTVSSVDSTKRTLTIQTPLGQQLPVLLHANTVYSFFDEVGQQNAIGSIANNQVVAVDMDLRPDGALVGCCVRLLSTDRDMQGIITSVSDDSHFKMVVVEAPSTLKAKIGDEVSVTLAPNAVFAPPDADGLFTVDLRFASGADLVPGQKVSVHATEDTSTANPILAVADRIRLRSSAITGRVSSVDVANKTIVLDSLPAVFTTASPSITSVNARTAWKTHYDNVGDMSGISAGDTVSVRGVVAKNRNGALFLQISNLRKR